MRSLPGTVHGWRAGTDAASGRAGAQPLPSAHVATTRQSATRLHGPRPRHRPPENREGSRFAGMSAIPGRCADSADRQLRSIIPLDPNEPRLDLFSSNVARLRSEAAPPVRHPAWAKPKRDRLRTFARAATCYAGTDRVYVLCIVAGSAAPPFRGPPKLLLARKRRIQVDLDDVTPADSVAVDSRRLVCRCTHGVERAAIESCAAARFEHGGFREPAVVV